MDDGGYEIEEAEVAYWGRCPDCLAKAHTASRRRPPARGRRRRTTRARSHKK
jgi:Fur family ferric uptake transcriptional regulator